MAIAEPSLSRKSPMSPSQFKQRKALEIKKRLFRKRTSDPKKKTKKVTFEIPDKSIVSYQTKVASISSPPDSEAKSSAMARAREVQANLASEFPSFVKPMLPSHVTGGFWLSFPKEFSDLHLPNHDDTVVLVDENEQEFETKYLIAKNGLSGGWRGYSIAHKLLEGDVLVFQLVKPCKFKVYTIRVNSFTEVDGAIGLLNLDACAQPMDICTVEKSESSHEAIGLLSFDACGKPIDKCSIEKSEKSHGEAVSDSVSLDSHQENMNENAMVALDQVGSDSDDLGSEVLEGIRFSQSVVSFKDVKSFEDFNILVGDLIIDSEIPKHLQIKYYELCRSQNSYLHDCLLDGLNIKLAAGVISETVNIADAIRASKLATSHADFEIWDKTLKAFEELGMQVGFLRTRIRKLVSLSFESKEIIESKKLELVKAEEEMRSIEEKLVRVRGVVKNLDVEIEKLKMKGDRLEPVFQSEANAPW